MLKSLNMFAGASLGAAVVLTLAYNFADRNVATFEGEPVYMSEGASNPDTLFIAAANATPEHVGTFGLGRVALPEEIAAWDKDVAPDGTGLPVGSGSVADGEYLFSDYCAVCHGEFAEGVGNWPKLSGGEDTLADKDPLKPVGSYWPHLTTGFDYVRRSMPFGNAQSLTDDEVYAITAYILYSNYLVDDDFVLSNENLLEVEMPNAEGFIADDRPETEYAQWSIYTNEPCMTDCKDSVEITMRAAVLDVTPEETKARKIQEMIDATNPRSPQATAPEADAEEATAAPAAEAPVAEVATAEINEELAAAGGKVFKKCKACHQIGEGATNRSGPQLNGLMGRAIGGVDGFKYSKVLTEMGASGIVWNDETLAGFLANPKAYAKGTKMSFVGLKKDSDVAAIIEYIKAESID